MSAPSLATTNARDLDGHTGPVNVLKFNTEGNYCLSGGQDKTIRLWKPSTGMAIKVYEGHGRDVTGLAVSPDNSRLASCGGDKAVFLWDVISGKIIRKLSGHYQKNNDVAFNDDATVLVSASFDATVRVWDCRTNSQQALQVLDDAKDSVSSVVVRGHEIITGSVDERVRIYDIRMGQVFADCIGDAVTCVSLSKDGNCLLVSTLDNKLRLFDKANGTLLNEFSGHKNADYKVASCFNNNDSHVISGSEDKGIYVWDLVEGTSTHHLKGHDHVVIAMAHHPKTAQVVSGSGDGKIKVWE